LKTLLALLITGILAWTKIGHQAPARVALMPAGLMAPVAALLASAGDAVAAAPRVVPVGSRALLGKLGAVPLPADPTLAPLAKRVEINRPGRRVVIPSDCRTTDGSYDVLVHFHGVPERVTAAFEQSGIKAILVIVNLGIGSGPYERGYARNRSLSVLLERVHQAVDKHCPSLGRTAERRLRRVALSSWSAGYGAIYRILDNDAGHRLVDAVLISDGLHVGFVDKRRRTLNALQMAPFDRFAEQAVRGQKLFAIAHTEIETTRYASAGETASYLISSQDALRQPVDEAGPRPGMRVTSRASRGSFQVAGYAGRNTTAHCDQLYAIGDTLFSQLAARWER
jgi:hypothetical protein